MLSLSGGAAPAQVIKRNHMEKLLILLALVSGLMSCGKLQYQIEWNMQEVMGISDLEIFPGAELSILNSVEREHESTWNPVWGQFSSIRDHYKELDLEIESKQVKGKLLARIYDEGVAFRFILNKGPKPGEATFACSYALPDGSSFYVPYGETEPRGPLSFVDIYKLQIAKTKNGRQRHIEIPVVVETPGHQFLALLESDLYAAKGFQVMHIEADPENGKLLSSNEVELDQEELVSPWRVILLGESAGDLLTSTMTVNLATPSELEDTEWIKPGKTLWDWRVHGFTAPDGFIYGTNTNSYIRFIDFAAANGVEYFLIDASWFTDASGGQFVVSENLFPYYQSLGMKGIKYGFMGKNVPFTRNAIRMSTEGELLIDFHDGPLPFTGIRRTYPNAITREYCHAQQDSRRAFTPESFLKMAFINALTGPLDMNNGNFDITGINKGQRDKGPRIQHSYLSTAVSEAARTLVIFSGLVCIPDAPEAYEAKKDLFEFIQKLPVGLWDESRVLNSSIGEYITTARRHGDEWFIGSVINQQGGTLNIELDFLDEGREYKTTFYEDTEETHCKDNPEVYQIRKGKVKKGDLIKAELAPGGGHCMWIRPAKSFLLQL